MLTSVNCRLTADPNSLLLEKVAGEKLELLRQYCPRLKLACFEALKEVIPEASLPTTLDGVIRKVEKLPQYIQHWKLSAA
jgi:hypothetical protein